MHTSPLHSEQKQGSAHASATKWGTDDFSTSQVGHREAILDGAMIQAVPDTWKLISEISTQKAQLPTR